MYRSEFLRHFVENLHPMTEIKTVSYTKQSFSLTCYKHIDKEPPL